MKDGLLAVSVSTPGAGDRQQPLHCRIRELLATYAEVADGSRGRLVRRFPFAAHRDSIDRSAKVSFAEVGRMGRMGRICGPCGPKKKGPLTCEPLKTLVPARRVELPTFALRMRCSTN